MSKLRVDKPVPVGSIEIHDFNNVVRAIEREKSRANIGQDTYIRDEAQFFERKQDELVREQVQDIRNYRDLRNKYAYKVFFFMCVWSAMMFAVLITKGFWPKFGLTDIVLTTLAGGTTVSVVGLVGFMMQGLFNSKQKH